VDGSEKDKESDDEEKNKGKHIFLCAIIRRLPTHRNTSMGTMKMKISQMLAVNVAKPPRPSRSLRKKRPILKLTDDDKLEGALWEQNVFNNTTFEF